MYHLDINVILDRSGSMGSCKASMDEAVDSFMYQQQQIPSKVTVNLYQFDDTYEVVYEGKTLDQVPKSNLIPRGGTALLDAIARTIDNADKRYAANKPDKAMFIIITDGQENSSQIFSGGSGRNEVFNMITDHRDNLGQEFMYLGANQDAIAQAVTMGINPSNAANYVSSGAKSRESVIGTVKKMSDVVTAYRNTSNTKMDSNLDAEEQADWVKEELRKLKEGVKV